MTEAAGSNKKYGDRMSSRIKTPPLPFRIVLGRPRLFIALALGAISYPFLSVHLLVDTRAVLAWDVAVAIYLIFTAIHFVRSDHTRIAIDSARQEEGEWALFFLILVGAVMSLLAIIAFSGLGKAHKALYVGFVTATLAASWLMTNVSFAYRYAHEYYSRDPDGRFEGGLKFPDEPNPDYFDFIYYAFVIGMTFQVSDVNITSRKLRRLATVQGLIGFVFNTVILALSVNIAAGLV
jgi:uncharacterized membrane protein